MGRKPKKDGAAEAAPKTDISEDQLQALFFQSKKDYERALGVKQKADADFKNCCRRIKAAIGTRYPTLAKEGLLFCGMTVQGEQPDSAQEDVFDIDTNSHGH